MIVARPSGPMRSESTPTTITDTPPASGKTALVYPAAAVLRPMSSTK